MLTLPGPTDSQTRMTKTLSLLYGHRPPLLNIVAANLFGVCFGGYVLSVSGLDAPLSFYLFALTWDLGSGLVSNATEPTRAAWRGVGSRTVKILFVVAHLAIFPPLILWLVPEDASMIVFLHMMLLAKLLLFVGGQVGKGARLNLGSAPVDPR